MIQNKKVVVGVSGGVDSSIALVVLKKQGYTPIAVSLKLPVWKGAKCKENSCCTDKSLAIAKDVCKKLGIEHHVIDERKNFEKEVVGYFKKELKKNRTPNPCVICNRYSKIKSLIDFADKHKIKYVATGHYAKIKDGELFKPRDKSKDQTYGLCLLPKAWLKRIIFPLQDMTKEQVYKLAQKQDFDFFSKTKQSQDFCFVSGNDTLKFVECELGNNPGEIINQNNKVVGKHNGLWFYTIGQRKGLGQNGTKYYVNGFDSKKNQLLVTTDQEKKIKETIVKDINFISKEIPKKIQVKIRHSPRTFLANIEIISKTKAKIIFLKPQLPTTPGQFCVFYDKDKCLGGGTIE